MIIILTMPSLPSSFVKTKWGKVLVTIPKTKYEHIYYNIKTLSWDGNEIENQSQLQNLLFEKKCSNVISYFMVFPSKYMICSLLSSFIILVVG